MTLAWPSSPMTAIRSSMMIILRIIVVALIPVGPSSVVTVGAGAAADRPVLILLVVDNDLRGAVCSCC